MFASRRVALGIAWLSAAFLFLRACTVGPASSPSAIPHSPTPARTARPTPTQVTPPLPTFDAEVQPYLENAEDILRHSAVVVKDRALGIPDACPDLYITAFPYTEPDRSGGMTLEVTALKRQEDGTIIQGEHHYLWNLKGEGVDPERCKQVLIQDRSEPGLIRISFQVQDPYDSSWRIGVASGVCPSVELSGYFYLMHPDDFQLLITRYSPQSPEDYWLRDGDQLLRYRWEPWQETLLWTLNEVPGEIAALRWDQEGPDQNGDGSPDLVITWDSKGSLEKRYYSLEGTGFKPLESRSSDG